MARRTKHDRRGGQAAFTLIELMIVVAIVGILATLGVVGYRKMVNASHTGEATNMLQSIRVAQESFRAETGSYAAISTSLDATLCPVTTVKAEKVPWNPDCNGGLNKWGVLPVHTDGPVLFRYTTVSGRAGENAPAPPTGMGQTVSFGGAAITQDWFVSAARADTDGNSVNVTVVSTSWNNALFVDREGE
jgi:type IV pilus assembly protein PilA